MENEREVRRRWSERIGSSRDEAGRSKVRGIWAAWWAGPDYFLLLLLSFPFSFSFFFIIYHSKLLFKDSLKMLRRRLASRLSRLSVRR